MSSGENHIVIVNFTTTPENQELALEMIGNYVGDFLSKQTGFLSSRLHASKDGNSVVHYAEWNREEDFQAFAKSAQSHPDLPALLAYEPKASAFKLKRVFPEA
jgi:heme-degrading monooxygenase HmoA